MVKEFFSTQIGYGEVINRIEEDRRVNDGIDIVYATKESRVYHIDDATVVVASSKNNCTNFTLGSRNREGITSAKSRLDETIESKLVEGVMI